MKILNPITNLRQLKKNSKQLQKMIISGKFNQLTYKKRHQWLARIERLKQQLSKFKQFKSIRKAIAGATIVLSLAFGNTMNAQTFGALQTNPFGLTDGYNVTFPASADLDGDGDFDFIIGEASPTSGNNLRYFENTGNASVPSFTQVTVNSPIAAISGYYFAMPTLVDIDNDGDYDLFLTEYYGAINYYENIGTPTSPNFTTAQTAFGLNTGAFNIPFVDIEFADMDNDGDFDVIASGYYSPVYYYENTGDSINAAFSTPVQDPFGINVTASDYGFPAIADIDGDGDLDLFLGSYYADMEYYQNTGTLAVPVFGSSVQNPFGIALNAPNTDLADPLFIDIDNDGDMDLFAGSYGTTGAILYQENLTISIPNNVPTSADTIFTMNQDETAFFVASDFPFTDADTAQTLNKIKIINVPLNGTFNLFGFPVSQNQEITVTDLVGLLYIPQPGQYGTNFDNFTFEVSDGLDFSAAAYTFTINVNALPSTTQTTVETVQDTDYTFNVADFTFNDPNGGTFQEIQIVTLPAKGEVKYNGTAVLAGDVIATSDFSNLVFSPEPGETGFPHTDFLFAVGDGTGFSQPNSIFVNVNFPISTNGINKVSNFKLTPNPSSDFVNLQIETPTNQSANLTIQNLSGQIILNQNIELNSDFNVQIDINNWTKGVYIIQVKAENGMVLTKKLVVQ